MVAPFDYDSDDECFVDPAAVPDDDFFEDDASATSSISFEPDPEDVYPLPLPVEIGPDGLPVGFPVLVRADEFPVGFPLSRNNAVSPAYNDEFYG